MINRIKEIIVENYHPDKIVLFGSYARGDFDEQSDIDILVISDRENDLPRYRRGLDVRIKLSEVETIVLVPSCSRNGLYGVSSDLLHM